MNHDHFINHCLTLASKGRGKVGINPMVGSVLVREDQIIAEAFHEGFGLLHAERALLEHLSDRNRSGRSPVVSLVEPLSSADVLYVNLEPCCHQGKTPPCTDIILEKGIKIVVFGMYDPNPEVSGKGIELLRNNGVLVTGPINPELCERFNKGFVSLQTNGRPYITLKRAQTSSGAIAKPDGSPLKITSDEQDVWSHTHLRSRHDAILVGVGTIVSDDPQLTVRYGDTSYQPYRIILDPELRIPLEAKVLNDEYAKKTIIITQPKTTAPQQHLSSGSVEKGIRIIEIPMKGDIFDLDELFNVLTTPTDDFHGISSILIEGGRKTWEAFESVKDEEVVLTNSSH